METAGARKRVAFGKRLSQPWDWFVEQLEDRPVGSVAQWLRQCLELVPGPVGETENPVTH